MMRPRAVAALIAEEIAGVHRPRDPEDEWSGMRTALSDAARRALLMVGLSWTGLAVLLVTRDVSTPFLGLDRHDLVFTIAALIVAVFSGFRLGQWEKYRAAARALDDLAPDSEI